MLIVGEKQVGLVAYKHRLKSGKMKPVPTLKRKESMRGIRQKIIRPRRGRISVALTYRETSAIFQIMEHYPMTYATIAEKVGLSESQIVSLMNGKRNCSPASIIKIRQFITDYEGKRL